MLSPTNLAVRFYAFFSASKVGKTGLTVTVDVYRGTSLIVTAGSATEIGGGLYTYQLASGSTGTAQGYSAVFKTADTTVDAQHVPSLWIVGEAQASGLSAGAGSTGGLPLIGSQIPLANYATSGGLIVQGSGPGGLFLDGTGGVVVGGLTVAALQSFVTDDTGLSSASAGSVAKLASGHLAAGVVASTTGTTTTLDAGAVNTASYYDNARLVLVAGTGAGQERVITGYASGRVATHAAWTTNPTAATNYELRVGQAVVSGASTAGLVAIANGAQTAPTGTAASGSTDNLIAALPAALASAANINVYAPASGAGLDLYRGDSYENSGGRAITVTKSSLETTWPTTLSTVDIYCKPTPQTLATYASAASLGPVSCTVTQATGSSQAFRVDLTSAQLATLQAAVQTPANGYTYWIVANRATAPATLRSGPLNVRPDYSAT